jgi:hypothetical protein
VLLYRLQRRLKGGGGATEDTGCRFLCEEPSFTSVVKIEGNPRRRWLLPVACGSGSGVCV